jgi:hypothetical protein
MNNQVIVIEKTMLSKHCLIFCPVCETWTSHYLSKLGDFYACGCGGNFVEIELKEDIEDEAI